MCSFCGAAGEKGFMRFCRAHWFAVELDLRRRWWAETDYGKIEPSSALVADMLTDLGK